MPDYEFSEKVNFKPYIGSEFDNQELRVFILGESFINNGNPKTIEKRNKNTQRVKEVIEEIISHTNKQHRYIFKSYDNMLRMLLNIKKIKTHMSKWNNFAFTNFFQKYIGDKSKGSHHKKYFDDYNLDLEESRQAFSEYMPEISPDLTIAWGISTFKNNWIPFKETRKRCSKELTNLYTYDIEGEIFYIWFIPHPSNQRWFKWKKLHLEYLKIKKFILDKKKT